MFHEVGRRVFDLSVIQQPRPIITTVPREYKDIGLKFPHALVSRSHRRGQQQGGSRVSRSLNLIGLLWIMTGKLVPGLYDVVITNKIQQSIEKDPSILAIKDELTDDTGVRLLSRHLLNLIERALTDLKTEEEQIELTNHLVQVIVQYAPDLVQKSDSVRNALLKELKRRGPFRTEAQTPRPGIPLSHSELLTNASNDHRIGHELKREIESADQIDILVAFIKWSGLNLIRDVLHDFIERGGALRIITTVYMKATQRRVLDQLVQMGGKIKISYDTRRTRLHAKAWLIRRNTGFSTAFIGSSNLSAAAQIDGLEWNIRLSKVDAGRIINKIEGVFNSYWEDNEFETYDGSPESQSRFDEAVKDSPTESRLLTRLEVHPYPFQQEILDKLQVERTIHGQTRNLVVAATGTGKTVMAALDYRRLSEPKKPFRLLFVAHRTEILTQSQQTFQEVLKHHNFGEIYAAGLRPEKLDHVFASVQSLQHVDLNDIPPNHFEMIIVDEFHHAAAKTYQRILKHFQPRYLLGLTATPERADGRDILNWFEDRIAVELRIWDAIDRGLLVPFHYFGRHDGGDLSRVRWVRGRYDDEELSRIFTADDIRVRKILQAVQEYVIDPLKMRALGFCVSISHAEFMTRKFNDAGIPAACIVGTTPKDERKELQDRLRHGDVNILFSVDVLGEGVDIPPVDTILMLRPTSSATVFLQQIGRGLRHSKGKDCLTVLDFISTGSQEFRFDRILGAMLGGGSRRRIKTAVERNFPFLPSGCALELDRKSQNIILNNLKAQLRYRTTELQRLLSDLGEQTSLQTFLSEAGLSVEKFYSKKPHSFTLLSRNAGVCPLSPGQEEAEIGPRMRLLIHVDDERRINFIRRAAKGRLDVEGLPELERRRLLMLLCLLLGLDVEKNLNEGYNRLLDHPSICDELLSLTDILHQNITHLHSDYTVASDIPLELHASYSLDEISAAFNLTGNGRVERIREGVRFDQQTRCNLLFVTIQKSKKYYSCSTLYQNYATGPRFFRWQSQNRTRSQSKRGQRHIDHKTLGVTPLLFVRSAKKTDFGLTMPYQFLGPVSYRSHEGEQPMSIIWQMMYPIPSDIVRSARIAA